MGLGFTNHHPLENQSDQALYICIRYQEANISSILFFTGSRPNGRSWVGLDRLVFIDLELPVHS